LDKRSFQKKGKPSVPSRYWAEAFEAHQQETTKAMATDKATKNMPVKNGKSR